MRVLQVLLHWGQRSILAYGSSDFLIWLDLIWSTECARMVCSIVLLSVWLELSWCMDRDIRDRTRLVWASVIFDLVHWGRA